MSESNTLKKLPPKYTLASYKDFYDVNVYKGVTTHIYKKNMPFVIQSFYSNILEQYVIDEDWNWRGKGFGKLSELYQFIEGGRCWLPLQYKFKEPPKQVKKITPAMILKKIMNTKLDF